MTTDREVLTPEEVAEILRCSVDTVTRRARAGDLPGAFQLTDQGRWKINAAEFRDWLHKQGRYTPDPNAIPARSRRAQMLRNRRTAA